MPQPNQSITNPADPSAPKWEVGKVYQRRDGEYGDFKCVYIGSNQVIFSYFIGGIEQIGNRQLTGKISNREDEHAADIIEKPVTKWVRIIHYPGGSVPDKLYDTKKAASAVNVSGYQVTTHEITI